MEPIREVPRPRGGHNIHCAAEIRIRAERRLGEMLREQKETVGLNTGTAGLGRPSLGGTKKEPPKSIPTLADIGINKKLSSRAQKLAAVPIPAPDGRRVSIPPLPRSA
jgi:hypothetical protein